MQTRKRPPWQIKAKSFASLLTAQLAVAEV